MWFANIFNAIGNLANDISTAIGETFKGLFSDVGTILDYLNPLSDKFILSDLFTFLGNILEPLSPFSDKFILKDVINSLGNLLDYLNPFSENFILKKVLSFLGTLIDYVNPCSENFIVLKLWEFGVNIVSYINPFSDNFLGKKIIELLSDLLKFLFVPSDGYFDNKVNEIKAKISEKIPYQDYIDMFETVKQVESGEDISIDLNGYQVAGNSFNAKKFIDFSWITKYKTIWYSWCRGIIFILLIIYNINQIMKLFRGYNVGEGISRINQQQQSGGGQ